LQIRATFADLQSEGNMPVLYEVSKSILRGCTILYLT